MPVYKCKRCEFIVNNTNKMIAHIIRNKCKPSMKLTVPLSVENIQEYIIDNPFVCTKCTKTFTSKSNLEKHVNNNCKKNQEDSTVIQPVMINSNNTIINQNNVTINVTLPHKKTNIDHLTDEDYFNILGRSLMSIPLMIEKIHFNENNPENHNIYIPNIKNKFAMLYNGSEWSLHSRDEIIDSIIVDNEMRLEDWLSREDIQEKYPTAFKRFELYLKLKEKSANVNRMKEDVLLLLYNKRNMIDRSRQKHIIEVN